MGLDTLASKGHWSHKDSQQQRAFINYIQKGKLQAVKGMGEMLPQKNFFLKGAVGAAVCKASFAKLYLRDKST